MTSPKPIPESDHIIRRIPFALQDRNPDTDELNGFFAEAFNIRPSDQGGLSHTWLEYFTGNGHGSVGDAIEATCSALKNVPKTMLFAFGNVEKIKESAARSGHKVRILHEPTNKNKGHAVIRRLPDFEVGALEFLANAVYTEARDYDGIAIPIVARNMAGPASQANDGGALQEP